MAKKGTNKDTHHQHLTEDMNEMKTKSQKAADASITRYEIEDNIPVPTTTRRGAASRFPLEKLQPNQSFRVLMSDEGVESIAALKGRVRSAIYSYKKRTNNSAIFLTAPTEDQTGLRVWRKPDQMQA